MSSRIPHRYRSLLTFSAALMVTGSAALWAADTPPAPPVGNALPAGGAAQEPGSDKPKPPPAPSATPAAADASTPAPSDAKPAAPKEMTIRADRDYEISRTVGRMLEEHHYLQHPIDAEMSERWLSNYLLALDDNHLFFLQSDVDEFTAKYGSKLGDLLHGDDEAAALAPAFEIFQRFLQRVRENVSLAEKAVHEKYEFAGTDSFTMPTKDSHWLKDKATSDALWRSYVKSDLLTGLLDKKQPDSTAKKLVKRYESLVRYWGEMDDLDVLEQYLCGLTHAYDPHSDYFQPDESENFSIQAIDHSVTGIGAELRSDDGYAVIQEVIAGGPADLDKRLKPGDKILAVGQGTKEPVDAVNMRLNHVVDMIRGAKGSIVHLVIQPAGAGDSVHKDIILKRDLVSLKDSLAKADIIDHQLPGGVTEKIGVIHLHDFYNNTTNEHSAAGDCAKLITRLKKEKVAGIILDMRNNGGGLLDQAIELTSLFVKGSNGEGQPVVQVRRYDSETESLKTENNQVLYSGPLVVMVNRMSASATEIVAAALQDYGRAVIVGDKSTHGKGTVQTLIRLDQAAPLGVILDPGNELKMTVQKFYRVAGGSTQEKGVMPDIVLPSLLDAFDLGETTLKYYLPWDTIPPVEFARYNLSTPYVPALKTKSDGRVSSSTDFDYLKQDIAFYKKRVHDTTVSLNEKKRQEETASLKALTAARKKDLENRRSGRDKDLELTLDMVDKNLPAAVAEVKKPRVDPDSDDGEGSTPDLESTINTPAVDPQLNETVNIMTDYVNALQNPDSKLVQSTSSTPAASPEKQAATTP